MLSLTRKQMPLLSRSHSVLPEELYAASLAIDCGAEQLCAGLTADQLSWSSGPEQWSIAQNLAHLRTTTEVFLPAVDAALTASRTRNLCGEGPFTLSLYGRTIVWHLESRRFFKLQAPQAIWPRLETTPEAELSFFLVSQSALRQRMETATGLHLTALRFPSPLVGCFRVNLLEFFSAVNAHARRHLRQAGRLRQALLASQR